MIDGKLPMLHVEGNRIVDPAGREVWLQGVAIPSLEWVATGEQLLRSVHVAIDDWNVNVIRLPVREHFWAGTGEHQSDGGAAYRRLIESVVRVASAEGVYVVIDLHRFRAPLQSDADFWTQVATKYADHPGVLFDLFNEPHNISWDVWRNGGKVTEERKGTALSENAQPLVESDSIGMQGLVDAVRNTGAKNIVIVGGIDWAYDLSGVLNGYAVDDHGGNGVVYSTHVYNWKTDWQKSFIDAADKHPLFLGECGAEQTPVHFLPADHQETPATWVPDMLGLIQKHRLNWTGWSFHPGAVPVLIKDWTYTPNTYWGLPVQQALHGKRFETTRLR